MKKILLSIVSLSPFFVSSQNLLTIPDTLTGTIFNLHVKDTTHEFYNSVTTNTMGVNASYLGPTLILNKGDSIQINVFNDLMDTTTIHWHGMHVSPTNDGGPHSTIPPSTVWSPSFEVRDHAATYWYHPHLHMMTNMQATMGAAGIIIVRDNDESSLSLPRKYGVDDFPLVLQSKCFDNSKQIVVGNHSDSVFMINGTINAYLPVPAQVIRLRLLNASSERNYRIGLSNNANFYQIGTDGGLLDAPIALTRLNLAPGERAEILVDLTSMNGQTVYLMNYGTEFTNGFYGGTNPAMNPNLTSNLAGYSANILNGNNFTMLELQVIAPTTNPILTVPSALVSNTPYNIADANITRSLLFTTTFTNVGPFQINGTSFDMNVINYSIPLNNTEIWTLTNQSPVAHPFHIHDVQFYITDMNGSVPPANMQGRKDVVLVMPMQTVTFITKFETFCNDTLPYMYHCHMLPHEDDGMMGQFVVGCNVNSIEENTEDFNLIYPNPSNGIFYLSDTQKIQSVAVFDLAGKVIHIRKTADGLIDLNQFSSGVYIVKTETKNGEVITQMITKE